MKKKYTVDVVAGTVSETSTSAFVVMTSDFYLYRIESSDKKLYAIRPRIGDVVWLYRVKLIHKVIDILPYKNNEELSVESYELEMDG